MTQECHKGAVGHLIYDQYIIFTKSIVGGSIVGGLIVGGLIVGGSIVCTIMMLINNAR